MLKFSKKKLFFSEIFFWKENKGLDGIFGTISFVKIWSGNKQYFELFFFDMECSNLINYLTTQYYNIGGQLQ
jgi:hypothetical protein